MEGKTQAIFARWQLEHGDCLSQRTFLVRHTTQLRRFGTGTDAGADELAFFSEGEIVTGGTCDMMEVDNRLCS